MVIKNTASTFTPATRLPLEELARDSALRGKLELPRTVVIVGPGRDGSLLHELLPFAYQRSHELRDHYQ